MRERYVPATQKKVGTFSARDHKIMRETLFYPLKEPSKRTEYDGLGAVGYMT